MSDAPVRCTIDGVVATVEICRAKARNTLDIESIELIQGYLKRFAEGDEARVVVLTGEGDKAFSAGADLSLMAHWPEYEAKGENPYTDLLHAMLRFPRPLVARVNGHALGGGLGLVLACDVALAAEDVTLGTPEVHVGLFPFMVLPLLSHHIGPKKAADMALTGRKVPAPQAVEMGIINRAVPREELDAEVSSIGAALSAGGPLAQMLGKEAVRDVMDVGLHDRIDRMARFFARGLKSEEFAEGVTAFMQKRPPKWTEDGE
jgi:enoyl-CoA hydratase